MRTIDHIVTQTEIFKRPQGSTINVIQQKEDHIQIHHSGDNPDESSNHVSGLIPVYTEGPVICTQRPVI